MLLVETDTLYSLLYRKDNRHDAARAFFEICIVHRIPVALSTVALIELDLTTKSYPLVFKGSNATAFEQILKYTQEYEISQLPITARDAVQSIRFREKYGITFFDSYYAAQAFNTKSVLISFDRVYERVEEIEYQHTEEFLKRFKR